MAIAAITPAVSFASETIREDDALLKRSASRCSSRGRSFAAGAWIGLYPSVAPG